MKTQMRFQKILMLVSLIVAALTFVYVLFFLTGSLGYATQYKYADDPVVNTSIGAEKLVEKSQSFVDTMVTLCIIFIVLAAVLFLTSCNSRRNYYITNYIAIGLFVAYALFMMIFIMVNVSILMNMFLYDIKWDIVSEQAAKLMNKYPVSKGDIYTFALGYVVAVVVLVNAVLLVLSTVWKVLLMKGEKQLLEGPAKALTEEVA